ncbi:uncharacterized protein LOC141856691 [Brevipalpus obovatus]|uniref:uncharacterized protein LOC141856691 n=1 Tax=Brevipalpus obovatus TaxID=246614 RepID=UPI003D9E1946
MKIFLLWSLLLITFIIGHSDEQFLNDTRFPLSFQIDLEERKENEAVECEQGIALASARWNKFMCPNGFRPENVFDVCCLGCSIGDIWFREEEDCKIDGEGLPFDAMRQCCEKYKSEAIQFARKALNTFLRKHKRPKNFDQLDFEFIRTEELTENLTLAYKSDGEDIQDPLGKRRHIYVFKGNGEMDDYEVDRE